MNVAQLLLENFAAKAQRPAIVEGATRRSYAEFLERVRRRAGFLLARGVEPGDRVAILAANGAGYLETYFAAPWVGAILVSPNPHLFPGDLATLLADTEPKLVLADDVFAEAAARAGLSVVALGDAVGELAPEDPVERSPEDAAQLYSTSGTTGRSKCVVLTHGNLVAHARQVVAALDLGPLDRWAHVAPMFHLADAWAVFALTLVGGRHVLQARFDAGATLALFEREAITLTNLVPTMLVRCLRHADATQRDLSSFRLLLSGGAPLEPRWVARAGEVFGGEYVQTYGMTETSPFLTLGLLNDVERALPLDERIRRRARTGRAFPGVELEVVDESGRHVALDDREVGEIRVRGASVTPGYWRRPEATREAIRDGWLYTGDLATIDASRSVDIVDRKKDMILTGGENVYSIVVERALGEHPAVVEAAVFGRPDEDWGERVCAAVTLSAPLEPAELEAFAAARLARFQVPKEILVLDALPRTASGKLWKAKLREA